MNEEKARLPSDVVGNTHTRHQNEIKRGWNRNTVKRILQNVTYLGWVKNGTLRKVSYKSKKSLVIPKEDWIIRNDMHEAIIDQESFDAVQEQIKSRLRVRKRKYDWLLHGLIFCKECGKQMSIQVHKYPKREVAYLHCNTYTASTNLKLCTPHTNNLEKVTEQVIQTVTERCKEYLEDNKFESLAKNTKNKYEAHKNLAKNEIKILEKKLLGINQKIDKIYDDKISGLIKETDFERMYKKILN